MFPTKGPRDISPTPAVLKLYGGAANTIEMVEVRRMRKATQLATWMAEKMTCGKRNIFSGTRRKLFRAQIRVLNVSLDSRAILALGSIGGALAGAVIPSLANRHGNELCLLEEKHKQQKQNTEDYSGGVVRPSPILRFGLHAHDGGADELAKHDGDDVKTVGSTALMHEKKIRNLYFGEFNASELGLFVQVNIIIASLERIVQNLIQDDRVGRVAVCVAEIAASAQPLHPRWPLAQDGHF
ncbi:hypothetical protein HG530_008574 [Fusarium avenaceum]|nr:hypothetical protein HG530_008574 [Fusarium avenaceum]